MERIVFIPSLNRDN